MIEKIGYNAGNVWNTLSEHVQLSLGKLKTHSGLNEKELHLALGWLAREKKVTFTKRGNSYLVELGS